MNAHCNTESSKGRKRSEPSGDACSLNQSHHADSYGTKWANEARQAILQQFRGRCHGAFVNQSGTYPPEIIVFVDNPRDAKLRREMQKVSGVFRVSFCTPGL